MPDRAKTLYLVDFSNLVFRMYYGIRSYLTAPDGTPTNAVFGVANTLLKLQKNPAVDYLVVVYDTGGLTFRHELFAGYKASRKEKPADLKRQFPLCRELVTALGIPGIEYPNYEADDVLGALAVQGAAMGLKVVIVSGDKDILQLVAADISVYDPMKDLTYDAARVTERFGIDCPRQVIDYLAICGDKGDDVPGLPKVGEKKAGPLLKKYGTLEGIIAASGELKGALQKNVEAGAELGLLSKALVTIATDLPVSFDLAAAHNHLPDAAQVVPLLQRFAFNSLLKEFGAAPVPKPGQPAVTRHTGGLPPAEAQLAFAALLDGPEPPEAAGYLPAPVDESELPEELRSAMPEQVEPVFTSGKYAGKTPREVFPFDPEYLYDVIREVPCPVDDEMIIAIKPYLNLDATREPFFY